MNTRQTARNRSEYEIDNITDEERDRERDEYERRLEQDEDRARRTDRRKSRDVMSRRVTGAEQPISKSILGYKRLRQGEAEVGGTPSKYPHPATVSSHAHIPVGAGCHEAGARSGHLATGSRTRRPRDPDTAPGERQSAGIKRTTEAIHRPGHYGRYIPRSNRRSRTLGDRRTYRSNEPATASDEHTAHGPKVEGAKRGRHGRDADVPALH